MNFNIENKNSTQQKIINQQQLATGYNIRNLPSQRRKKTKILNWL